MPNASGTNQYMIIAYASVFIRQAQRAIVTTYRCDFRQLSLNGKTKGVQVFKELWLAPDLIVTSGLAYRDHSGHS